MANENLLRTKTNRSQDCNKNFCERESQSKKEPKAKLTTVGSIAENTQS